MVETEGERGIYDWRVDTCFAARLLLLSTHRQLRSCAQIRVRGDASERLIFNT